MYILGSGWVGLGIDWKDIPPASLDKREWTDGWEKHFIFLFFIFRNKEEVGR
jgi:hypothetical protein